MSRSAAEARRALALALGLALGVAAAAGAQGAPVPTAGIELTRSVQQSLKRLQEQWLQWMSAFYQDNPARADEALRQIAATARQVGFSRLPDLSLGATARALQSAREGNASRARWALDAAEQFDPGRPETAFARATVARASGRWIEFMGATFTGYSRLFGSSLAELAAADLRLWLLTVLTVAAALFVVFQAVVKGGALYLDFQGALARHLPRAAAHLLAALLLLAPVALPGGPIWLLLFWSVLLWGYQSASERIVSAVVWLIVGVAPVVAVAEQERIALAQSPPLKAFAAFDEGRLYGGLLADLQVLRTVLPNDPAVLELMGDVHRTLGQWEVARTHYRQVVEAEPQNVAVLLNLGAYFFRKGDFGLANEYFTRAAQVQPPSAAARYNLSLSYSESYLFDDSTQALAEAKEIDAERVDQWVKTPNPDRVLSFNGSLARREEIRSKLRAAWIGGEATGSRALARLRRWGPLLASASAAIAALGLHLARRRRGYGEPVPWLAWRTGRVARWLRALVPPLAQVELGEGFAAFATILLLTALVLLPTASTIGVDLPTGRTPGQAVLIFISILGLATFVAWRVRAELTGETD